MADSTIPFLNGYSDQSDQGADTRYAEGNGDSWVTSLIHQCEKSKVLHFSVVVLVHPVNLVVDLLGILSMRF